MFSYAAKLILAKEYLESIMVPYPYLATIKMTKKPQEKTDKYGRYLAVLFQNIWSLEKEAHEMAVRLMPSSLNWRMVASGNAKERYWK